MSVLKVIISLVFSSASLIANDLPDLIKKMRERIAEPAQLNQIHSIKYIGKFKNSDNDFGAIEVSFQKPHLQRIEISSLNTRIIRLVGKNIGFIYSKNLDTNQSSHSVMPLRMYDFLRINAIENLFFFQPPKFEKVVPQLGDELDWDGSKAVEVLFKYPNSSTYTRYVELQTGRILATIIPDGTKVVEEGDFIVDKIRFPKKVSTFNLQDELISTLTFETIIINPKFEEPYFMYNSSQ